jgi:hypothetical protein
MAEEAWDVNFEVTPKRADSPTEWNTERGITAEQFRLKFVKEHTFDITGSGLAADHGWHKQGTAVCFEGSVTPTENANGDTLSSDDEGILWMYADGDERHLRVWTGSAWVAANRFGTSRIAYTDTEPDASTNGVWYAPTSKRLYASRYDQYLDGDYWVLVGEAPTSGDNREVYMDLSWGTHTHETLLTELYKIGLNHSTSSIHVHGVIKDSDGSWLEVSSAGNYTNGDIRLYGAVLDSDWEGTSSFYLTVEVGDSVTGCLYG